MSRTLKVALFDSQTSVISGLIRWETRSKYNHAAIVLRDGSVIESVEFAGVHRLPALEKAESSGDHVDLFEVPGVDADKAEAFLVAQLGLPYDWPDVSSFVSHEAKQEGRGKWFCSELVFAAIQAGGVTLLRDVAAYEVSPGMLSLSPLLIPAAA